MNVDDFVKAYEAALGTQDWRAVDPLVHNDACTISSNGAVHRGKEAVRAAFTRNFQLIKDEKYAMSNVHWVARTDRFAVFLFDFAWSGVIDGKPAAGAARGC